MMITNNKYLQVGKFEKMRYFYLFILFLSTLSANAISREKLIEYAQSLNGLKKIELKTAIYELIDSPAVLSYGSGEEKTWWGFYYTDRIAETGECVNRYSARKFYFPSENTGTAISGMNIEHSFPKSWWGGSSAPKAYKDLYNLYPSDSQANSSKSNYPMGIVDEVKEEEEGYDKVGTGTIDGVSGRNCWEPGDQYKGDFARAYMYMATCYQNLTWSGKEGLQELENNAWPTLKAWAYTLYLTWLDSDPIDELETARNNAVAEIQGNRNLFVDFPYLAEYVWGDSIDVAFDPYTSVTTAEDDTRYTGSASISVAKPVFSPDGGSYGGTQIVTISSSTPDVAIYYTIDGSSPKTDGIIYTEPITISESTTLKAVAVDGNGNMSTVATAIYVIYTTSTDFKETFDQCTGTGGNDGQFSGTGVASSSKTYLPDNEGWTATNYYGGDKCARFGSSSNNGTVTTPEFAVNGESTFTFKAAPWGSDGTSLKLTVNGNAQLSETELTMKSGEWTTYSLTLTGNGNVSITFTPAKRLFLDEVYAQSKKIIGDVNKDGSVTIADVTALVNIILGKVPMSATDYDIEAADVNNDGQKTIADVTTLVNIILDK